MRNILILGAIAVCAACAQNSGSKSIDREYQRVDYYESVFLPASKACNRAGGFMVFVDPDVTSERPAGLSYSDMKLAVMRGCAGT